MMTAKHKIDHNEGINLYSSTSKVVLEFHLCDTAIPPNWYRSTR